MSNEFADCDVPSILQDITDEFVDYNVPSILQNITGKYRVKGGRAHNAYFNSIYSRDWDIECTPQSAAEIERIVKAEAKISNHVISVENRQVFNSYHLTINDEDEPFMDLLIVPDYTLVSYQLDKISYIPLYDYVDDLIITISNRKSAYTNFQTTLRYNIDNINKTLRNELFIDIKLNLTQDPHLTIKTIQKAVIAKLSEFGDEYGELMNDIYVTKFSEIGEGASAEVFNLLFVEKLSQKRYKEWLNTQYVILKVYDQLVWSAILADEYYKKYIKMINKHKKSQRRLDDVEDIAWYILNKEFQEVLAECRDYQYLFTLHSEYYFLDCWSKNIIRRSIE